MSIVRQNVQKARELLSAYARPKIRIIRRITGYKYYDATVINPNTDDWYNEQYLGGYSEFTNQYHAF